MRANFFAQLIVNEVDDEATNWKGIAAEIAQISAALENDNTEMFRVYWLTLYLTVVMWGFSQPIKFGARNEENEEEDALLSDVIMICVTKTLFVPHIDLH